MEKIKEAIDLFLEPYKQDKNIQAALLTGSYALGYQNEYSDIDLYIISFDELNWRERGNKLVSDYLIEYFINPPKIILQEIEQNKYLATSLIVANGIKLFDKSGVLEILKEKAIETLNEPIRSLEENNKEMIKYYTHYYYNQMARAYKNNLNEFMFLYYTFLENIIYSYGNIKGIALPPKTKIYQYITDENYILNENLKKIEDKYFIELLTKCMNQYKHENMYANITELKDYFFDELLGGYNIDGWKIRTEINK